MTNFPDVDVIILSWNRAKLTLETVENILSQEGVHPKIWLVDQGSDPEDINTIRSFARNYSNIHVEELGSNLGVPGGRNIGMQLGSADYIVSIDNDAIFESKYVLRDIINKFDTNPELGIIGFRIKNYYTNIDDALVWSYPKAQLHMKEQEFFTTRFPGGAHAILRKVFNKVGGYDERLFFYWEEVDLSYKVINGGYTILYDPSKSILHKVSPEARISWSDERYYYLTRNAIYIHFKYYNKPLHAFVIALGYLIKGLYNKTLSQALKGTLDGVRLCYTAWPEIKKNKYILSDKALTYIFNHEKRYRGNLLTRVKNEVFADLPGRK